MELRDYLTSLRRAWLSILIITLVALVAAITVTTLQTPKYTATTRLFFGVQGGETGSDLANGSTFTEKQMSSYAEVATSPLVLNKVIARLSLPLTADQLAEQVVATAPPETVILEIAATHPDPAQAARIANLIGSNVAAVAGQLSPARQDGSQAVRATILAQATPPQGPSSPVLWRNMAIGLVLGLAMAAGVTLLRRFLDKSVRSEQDLRSVTGSTVLGTIPFDSQTPAHPVVMHDDTLGARSEAVRRLRTNLQFVELVGDTRSIVVTSSVPGEGKSTTALNLAVSMADAGLKVILVDADLRRPSVAQYLGLEGQAGLTTVLIGRAEVDEVTQPWQRSTLDILPAGQIPPNPSELLGSKAMEALIEQLGQTYDMVLLDSAPLLPVTDAAVLSRLSSGALVVVGADVIRRPQLVDALQSLETVGARVLGVVLNKAAKRDVDAYVYESGYVPESGHVPEPAWPTPHEVQPGARRLTPASEALAARVQQHSLAERSATTVLSE